jgi:NarL family two-component system response regulator LiaR
VTSDSLSTTPGSPLRILVVDDDPLVRRALTDALNAAPDIVVAAEAADGREAIDLAVEHRPDVVLMDVELPVINGIAATMRIRREAPDVHVVITANSVDDELGLLVLRAGASGFLLKDVSSDALSRALHGVVHGEAAISRSLVLKIIERLRRSPDRGTGMRPVRSNLTAREWQVLDLLCDGASTEAIASALVLSTETIRSHVKHVLSKLGAHSRSDAVAIANRLRGGDPTSPQSGMLDELALRRLSNLVRDGGQQLA